MSSGTINGAGNYGFKQESSDSCFSLYSWLTICFLLSCNSRQRKNILKLNSFQTKGFGFRFFEFYRLKPGLKDGVIIEGPLLLINAIL
jgi:hypothetical protein